MLARMFFMGFVSGRRMHNNVFATVGDALQKRLDKINREFLQLQVAMVPAERRDYRLIGSQGVFFECDR
jgi:hypothetical protein